MRISRKVEPKEPPYAGNLVLRVNRHPLHNPSMLYQAEPNAKMEAKFDTWKHPPFFRNFGSLESEQNWATGNNYKHILAWHLASVNPLVGLVVMVNGIRHTVARQTAEEVTAKVQLVHRGKNVDLELHWHSDTEPAEQLTHLIPIGSWLAFDPVKCILRPVAKGKPLNWVVDHFSKHLQTPHHPTLLASLPIQKFNELNLAWSATRTPCSLVPTHPLRKETPLRTIQVPANRSKPSIYDESDQYWVAFKGVVGDTALPIAHTWWDEEMKIIDQIDGTPLYRNPKRTETISQFHGQLLLANSESEAEAIYEAVAANPVLVKEKMVPLALSFLKKVFQTRMKLAETVRLRAHATENEDAPRWFLTVGEAVLAAEMAGLLATVCGGIVGGGSPKEDAYYLVYRDNFVMGMDRLIEACTERNISVDHTGVRHRISALDFKFDLSNGTNIDWFELKPEVRCQGALLPADQWADIVNDRRYEDEDGVMHVLPDESLARLEGLLKRMDREGRVAVNRLQLLDWLEAKSKGMIRKLPSEAEAIFNALSTLETVPEFPLPKGLKAKLRAYQVSGYAWLAFLYQHRFGGVLADDMGLGKTLQVIAFLAGIKTGIITRLEGAAVKPQFLVVVPPTLIFNWSQEIARFFPRLKVVEHAGTDRGKTLPKSDVILTSYDTARRDGELLTATTFDVIIFDEAQQAKNLQAARAQAMRQLKGRFKVCLTGTPLENHAGEYYAIIDLALPGIFGKLEDFQKSLRKSPEILQRVRPFVLRRTKDKILAELPPKVESDLFLDLDESQKAYYTRAVADVRAEVLQAYEDRPAAQAGIIALSALMRLRQICVSPALIDSDYTQISPKVEYLTDKLQEVIDEGQSALVFSQFLRSLDLVEANLMLLGIPCLRMDGNVPTAARKALVNSFQKGKKPMIFLISLKTGGAGLNLTRASHVYHIDPWWNPAVENQATDRAHRIGQRSTVFVTRLLMRHTVEEKILILKQRKSELFAKVLDGTLDSSRGLQISRDDFRFLLG